MPHHDLARGSHVTVGMAMTALFCGGPGLISPARAQLFGSSYTSTLPRLCWARPLPQRDRGRGRLQPKNFA
jgi:hypothetical protein